MRLMHTPDPAVRTRPSAAWSPPVDVLESDAEYLLRLDAPGVDENSVRVELEGGLLSIEGEREAHDEAAELRWTRRERKTGALKRNFRLPDAIDRDAIEAKLDRGVLEIRIPKLDRSRKIPIQ